MALSKHLQTLIPLLYFMALFLDKANSQEPCTIINRFPEKSTYQGDAHYSTDTCFLIDRFPANSTDLIYQGDARVQSGSTDLSLAGIDASGYSRTASVGRVLYSRPVQLWERSSTRQAGFLTALRFVIRPSTNGAAEGIAFFIAPVDTTFPDFTIGGNLGIYIGENTPSIFAVEFDTNYNAWDPTYHHIGINIQSRTSRNVTRFNVGTGQEVTARITYIQENRTINVVAFSGSQSAEVSYVFDLKTILPEQVQVGITSSTGWYDSIVGLPEIRQWTFLSFVRDNVNGGDKNEEAYIPQYVSV